MKNAKVLIFNNENGVLRVENVKDFDSQTIETNKGVYSADELEHYVDTTTGIIYYTFNADVKTLQIAEKLKSLKRSTVLKSLFDYQTQKSFDLMSLIPYIIIALLIIF